MRCLKPCLLTLLCLLTFISLCPFAHAHTVTIPTNCYLGLPSYGTYINFNSEQTFDNIYRSSSVWHFGNYQFSIQNANLTITRLFTNDILEATASTPTVTESTFTVNPSDAGYNRAPKSVTTGISESAWTWAAGTLTIISTHSSDLNYRVDWSAPKGPGGVGTYSPDKIDTYLSILPVYSNLTVYAKNQSRIEGYLKTIDEKPVANQTVVLATSWGASSQNQTNIDGYFSMEFVTPEYSGKYELTLTYDGDDTYNPASLGTALTVIGGKEPSGFQVSIPLLFAGIFLLVVAGVVIAAKWWEENNK